MQEMSYMPRKKSVKKEEKPKETAKKEAVPKKGTEKKVKPAKGIGGNPYVIAGIVLLAFALGIGIGYVLMGNQGATPSGGGARAILLADDQCDICTEGVNQVVSILDQRFNFSGIPRETISVQSKEGEKIYRKLLENNVNIVPLILLEGNVEGTDFYKTLNTMLAQYGGASRFLMKAGDYYVLLPDWPYRLYNPDQPETKILLQGDETVRTMLEPFIYRSVVNAVIVEEDAPEGYVLRVEAPEHILNTLKQAFSGAEIEGNAAVIKKMKEVNVELFVMSFCPYGNQAEEIIPQIKEKFGDRVRIIPHYIITDLGNNQFRSLHGDQELHQDVREVCVYKLFGEDAWLNFVLAINKSCSASNADSCWENVARDLNLDVDAIKECYDNEFASIASEEARISQLKGVTGSPTTLIGGWYRADIRDPNFPALLCSFMENPPEGACEGKIEVKAASGSCG